MRIFEQLPRFDENNQISKIIVHSSLAFFKTHRSLIGCICMKSASKKWLHTSPSILNAAHGRARTISVWRRNLWVNRSGKIVVELNGRRGGSANLLARRTDTGAMLWEEVIAIPSRAEWAEKVPAWPGAPTEEISAFLSDHPDFLIVGLARRARCSMLSSPSRGIYVMTKAPYGSQLDLSRHDPDSGQLVWARTIADSYFEELDEFQFTGEWAHRSGAGVVNLSTGDDRLLVKSPQEYGSCVRYQNGYAVSWHSKKQVGLVWFDTRFRKSGEIEWAHPKVKSTRIHLTEAGLAVQVNDQFLTWFGFADKPKWTVHVKPYIYKVLAFPDSDVIIGTDGRGGHFHCFEATSGHETYHHKPILAGKGGIMRIPDCDVIVDTEHVSKSYSVQPQLFVYDFHKRIHRFVPDVTGPCAVGEHGLLCFAGKKRDQLAVLDKKELSF